MTELMAADIGGTNARFARYEVAAGELQLTDLKIYSTAFEGNGESLVQTACADLGFTRPGGVCVAVAGPVKAGMGTLTNGALSFDAAGLEATLGCPSRVVNDFVAQGSCVPHLADSDVRWVGKVKPCEPELSDATRGVIGAGTGLGFGIVLAEGDEWRALPSEAGHAPFAPADALEQEVLAQLMVELDYVGWEEVVSGPGLVRLHGVTAQMWGTQAQPMTAPEIVAAALEMSDVVCHQTLEMFCSVLGSAAAMLALTACTTGGIYIAGGMVPRFIDFLADSGFRRRFEDRGALSDYVRAIPTGVVTHAEPGLLGAAHIARQAAG